jgi:hypothetical protein
MNLRRELVAFSSTCIHSQRMHGMLQASLSEVLMSYSAEVTLLLQCIHIVCPMHDRPADAAQHVMFHRAFIAFLVSSSSSLQCVESSEQQVVCSAVFGKEIQHPWQMVPCEQDAATKTNLPEAQRTLPLLNRSVPDARSVHVHPCSTPPVLKACSILCMLRLSQRCTYAENCHILKGCKSTTYTMPYSLGSGNGVRHPPYHTMKGGYHERRMKGESGYRVPDVLLEERRWFWRDCSSSSVCCSLRPRILSSSGCCSLSLRISECAA